MNLYDVRQFRGALYTLLVLGMSAYALAVESPAIFALGNGAIAFNWWLVHQGRFRPLPRWAANLATILALFYTVKEFFAPGAVVVLVIGTFLVLLQLVKLWEQRANRDLAQLLVLSLLLMVAASINTASLLFGVMLIVYLFLSLYCCLLLHLKVEAEFAKEAAGIQDPNPSPAVLRQDQRYLNRSMRRLTMLVSIFAVACAVVVFVFFPRGPGANFIGPVNFQPEQTLTGFDEQVSFDSVAKITQNPQIIAHVQLWKDDTPVRGGQILLRGVALDRYEAMGDNAHWSRSIVVDPPQRPIAESDGAHEDTYQFAFAPKPAWRQMISLEPTGTTVLFSLAGPTQVTVYRNLHADLNGSDDNLAASDRLTEPLTYEVISSNDLNQPYRSYTDLNPSPDLIDSPPPDAREAAEERSTQVQRFLYQWKRSHFPSQIDPRIHELAMRPEVSGANALGSLAAQRSIELDHVDPLDGQIASNIETYLRTHYKYTLDLTDFAKVRGKDRIVTFLYDLKRGHCEYFAGSMALMCQSLGIHARVVVGFKCDEYNAYTGSFIVRESDAHAWVEVLTADGWKTFDPTSEDLANPHARTTTAMDSVRHFLDFLEYTYATAVISYDNNDRANIISSAETKMTIAATRGQSGLSWLHREWSDWFKLYKYVPILSNVLGGIVALMVIAGLGFMGYFFWEKWMLRRRARRMGIASLPLAERERLARQLGFYDDLVKLLDRLGIHRPRHQTPMEFSDSLLFLPSEAYRTISRLTQVFYRVRFGQAELSAAQQRRLHNVLAHLADDLGRTMKVAAASSR
jgi:transglutaminase-like putative cysteine protease